MSLNRLRLDDAGEALIKGFEGLRLEAYRDKGGVWTIGWGHTDRVTEDSPPITIEEAERLFRIDIAAAEAAVNRLATVPINQNEFNALVSFTFNEGVHRLLTSTLLLKLNREERLAAATEFARWIYYTDKRTNEKKKDAGLIARRAKEAALFLTPA